MIGKRPEKGIGKGFRGVVTYLIHGSRKEKDPHRVTFTVFRNIPIEKVELVAAQMRMTASHSKRLKNPVYHFLISWRPEEAPSEELMVQVADRTCRDLGLDEHQAMYVGHDDTDHRHVHIVVNRVHPVTLRTWRPDHDFARIEVSLDHQSEELGYERVPGRHSNRARERQRQQEQKIPATSREAAAGGNPVGEGNAEATANRRPKDADFRKSYRERKPTPRQLLGKEQVQELATRVGSRFGEAQSWDDLARVLALEGVTLERKGQGLILVHDNKTMKLSQLGKQVRYAELAKRFNESYDRYLERTSSDQSSAAAEPRHPYQPPTNPDQTRRPVQGTEPTDDDAQTERSQGNAPKPQRPSLPDEPSRFMPKSRGVARRRRLARRRGQVYADGADAQDAVPGAFRPPGGRGEPNRRARPPRQMRSRLSGHEERLHAGERDPAGGRNHRSVRSRVATLRRDGSRASPDIVDTKGKRESQPEKHERQKRAQEPARKPISVPSRGGAAGSAPALVPEEIDQGLKQAIEEVQQSGKGLLDGIGVSLDDFFRQVQKSRPLVTGMDIVLALHRMGLVPKSHVEEALKNLEEQKRDPLLPSIFPEEPDREDDREM